jgi:hypothetical protein
MRTIATEHTPTPPLVTGLERPAVIINGLRMASVPRQSDAIRKAQTAARDQALWEARQSGASIPVLMQQFGLRKASVQRILNTMRKKSRSEAHYQYQRTRAALAREDANGASKESVMLTSPKQPTDAMAFKFGSDAQQNSAMLAQQAEQAFQSGSTSAAAAFAQAAAVYGLVATIERLAR